MFLPALRCMVTIKTRTITEEQRNTIVNKIKESYEFEQTAEKTDIISMIYN